MQLLNRVFPALTQPYYRQFWCSQWLALIGLWMQITAQQWLVYSLTDSALLLGLLGVAQFGPIMLFSLPAGVFVDRIAKRTLLRWTQAGFMLQAFALAALVLTNQANFYNVLVLAFIYGCIQTVDTPARQSFIPDLVEAKYLRNAISMNSANFNVARMIGPALAAIIAAAYGTGWLFLINGLCMLPVLYVYWHLPIEGRAPQTAVTHRFADEIRGGLHYASRHLPVLSSLLALAIVSVMSMNQSVFAPLYADRVLHEGIAGFGMVTSAMGVGSFTAALISATSRQGRPGAGLVFGSGVLTGLALVALALTSDYYLALGACVLFGFFCLTFVINVNTLLQISTAPELRGRILSIYSFVFLGATPLGNLITGTAIETLGTAGGMLFCGVLTVLLLLPIIWHIYRRMRIAPDIFNH